MIVFTLLVRDEADILAPILDYHFAAGADLFIVTDHRSVDETPAILERYRQGGRVLVIREESPTYDQHRWVTRMARMAFDAGATWVINCDQDEFWWARDGNLRGALETVPAEYDVLTIHKTDFPPVASEEGPFWERQVYREVQSFNLLGNRLPTKVCHRARPDIEVAQGNHSVSAVGLGAVLDDGRIEVLHFPLRTYAQFERKIVNGGAAYATPGSTAPGGETWKHAYSLWQRGELRSLYDERVLTPGRVDERLKDGTLVRDVRLRDVLRTLPVARTSGRTPGNARAFAKVLRRLSPLK